MSPKNWQIKKLGEVCVFKRGLTYSKKDEVEFSSNRVLRANNIDLESGALNLSDIKYINDSVNVKEEKRVKKNSILICTASGSKSHLGKVALIDDNYDFAFGGFMGLLLPNDGLDAKCFYYFLISERYKTFISELSDGANINNLKFSQLAELEIPIPPLSEQKRLVALLDDFFEKLEKAKENAEKNLKNAKELFEAYLSDIFGNYNSDWISDKLVNLTTKIGSGATPRGGKNAYHDGGISLIRSLNVYDDGFRTNKLAFINDDQAKKLSNVEIEEEDVLLNITGASVARCCVLPKEILTARVNQHVSIIRPKRGILLPGFLHYLLISKPYKDSLLGIGDKGGSTRQAITKAQIQGFLIKYPDSLEIQGQIVKRLNSLSDETKKLELINQQKLANIEELKKSILQKAFSGELTKKSHSLRPAR